MGMFDEVRPINITHENFYINDNGYLYQSKCLDCYYDLYIVFNNELYKVNEGMPHKFIKGKKIDGDFDIYIYRSQKEKWIEYNLFFKNGSLVHVEKEVYRGD